MSHLRGCDHCFCTALQTDYSKLDIGFVKEFLLKSGVEAKQTFWQKPGQKCAASKFIVYCLQRSCALANVMGYAVSWLCRLQCSKVLDCSQPHEPA